LCTLVTNLQEAMSYLRLSVDKRGLFDQVSGAQICYITWVYENIPNLNNT